MRADINSQNDANTILQIGNGTLNDINGKVKIPKKCLSNNNFIEEIFGNDIKNQNYEAIQNSAILAPYNKDVIEINEKVLTLFPGEEKSYLGIDNTPKNESTILYQPEVLNTLNSSDLPVHELKLKKNVTLMLLRNLNVEEGLCSGARLQLLEMKEHVLKCKISTGGCYNKIVFLPRITLMSPENVPFTLYRHQFPVKLAFCIGIYKSQGQTFNKINLFLANDVFTHGQLYVGISRVRNWESLKIKIPENNKCDRKVLNIVYTDALLN
uniref:ATP-dependent DNA helicase n=1 Tax=Rhabditophanes sp. KR3021 TaxID=114890 RepID=A0AC35TYC6_9BILA